MKDLRTTFAGIVGEKKQKSYEVHLKLVNYSFPLVPITKIRILLKLFYDKREREEDKIYLKAEECKRTYVHSINQNLSYIIVALNT